MLILINNENFAVRFVPCAAGWRLLKQSLATRKRAVAQKVLLLTQWLETRAVLNRTFRRGFKFKTMNTTILQPGSLRGKTSGRETQPHNLTTKGRNPRQIHE
jgi:hypothetical protein